MRPDFKIEAQDKDITKLVNDRLVSLCVTDDEGITSDLLEIVLDDRDNRLIIPPVNSELKVWLGYKGEELFYRGLFVFDEYELEGKPDLVTLRAKAAHAGNSKTFKGIEATLKEQRTRSWSGQTLESIAVQIAKEAGLTPRVFLSLGKEVIAQVDQTAESNRNLLTRLARERNAVFKVTGGYLLFVPRGQDKRYSGATIDPVYLYYGRKPAGIDGKPSSALTSWRLVKSESNAYRGVQANWHDIEQAEQLSVIAGDGAGPIKILKGNYPNADEAGRAAVAELDRITRGKSAPEFTMPGQPLLGSESIVEASGLRSQFNGTWSVKKATHRYRKTSGYVTVTECEVPATKHTTPATETEAAE
jgi:phage protein D